MKQPQEYIDFLKQFDETGNRAVKVEELNRDDYLCLKMAAYCLDMPIEVRTVKGRTKGLFLIRKVTA